MELIAKREGGTYIVKYNEEYYLINIFTRTKQLADPPDSPDMFLKFGYFENADEISVADKMKIEELIKGL